MQACWGMRADTGGSKTPRGAASCRDKHGGASVANVATKWVLGSAAVPAVILGARNATHVEDYKALFSFELDDEDRAGIRNVLGRGESADRGLLHVGTRRQMVKRMASLSEL